MRRGGTPRQAADCAALTGRIASLTHERVRSSTHDRTRVRQIQNGLLVEAELSCLSHEAPAFLF